MQSIFNAFHMILFASGYSIGYLMKVFVGRENYRIFGISHLALLGFAGLSLFLMWQQVQSQHSANTQSLIIISLGFVFRWFYSPNRY